MMSREIHGTWIRLFTVEIAGVHGELIIAHVNWQEMKFILGLFAHLMVTVATLVGPGGAKAVVAQNLLLKQ
jgi:hypothetical protein